MFVLFFAFATRGAAQVAQIGSGTEVPSFTLYSPTYRYSATSTTTGARSNIIYEASELSAAGIMPGTVITTLSFHKTNDAEFVTPADYQVYMANTSNTPPLSTSTSWASILASHTQVYSNNAYNVPFAAGWVSIPLSTPFTYTGGSLEIATSLSMVGNGGATDAFKWEYTNGFEGHCIGVANLTSANLNGTTAQYKHRPNIQIGYIPNVTCSGTPTPGISTASSTSICPNTTVTLNLDNYTVAAGITFEWESSPNNMNYTSISTPGISPIHQVSPANTTWYRCKLICSGGTPVYSTPIEIVVISPLAGTYTINSATATGGTNFASFSELASTLNCVGISAAVTVNVVPNSGPYNEFVDFGNISGSSATNTVTINGNGNEISYSTVTGERQIFRINGTKYLTIDSLTITPAGTSFGWGMLMHGGASHNTVRNCTFNLTASTSTTAANTAGIVLSGTLTSPTGSGTGATNNTIINNTFNGPTGSGGMYYGISLSGGADSNLIENNEIANFYFYGIYSGSATNNIIRANDIHRATKTSVTTFNGIYTANGAANNTIIEKNRIHSPGGTATSTSAVYPIYMLGDGTATEPVIIANNAVYNINQGGIIYGLYANSSEECKFYNNTVTLDQNLGASAVNYGIYATGTNTGTDFVNNLISITGGTGGVKRGFHYVSANSVNDAQKNVFYINSTQSGDQEYGYYISAYPTQAAFQTAYPTLEVNSIIANPQFTNAATGDLYPANNALMASGNPLALVTTDILGVPRSALPTSGAFEIPVTGCSGIPTAGTSTTSTTVACPSSPVNLTLTGNTVATGITFQWESSPNNTTYTSIAPADITADLSFNPATTAWYRCKVVCSGGTPVYSNPIEITVPTALSGTYTINAAATTGGTNYASFTDFANSVSCAGVAGPVTVNVVAGSGPYNEFVDFGTIVGSSATNTITINGNGNTISYSTTTSERQVFRISGTSYLTIDSLTIAPTGTTFGWGAILHNGAAHNTFNNCTFDMSANPSTTAVNSAGVVLSGTLVSPTAAGTGAMHNTISNSRFNGPSGAGGMYYAISMASGADSNIIVNNKLFDYHFYGVYLTDAKHNIIKGNEMARPAKSAASTFYGVYTTGATEGTQIVDNRIHTPGGTVSNATNTAHGIYLLGSGSAAAPRSVTNNVFYNINSGGTSYGIYLSSANNTNVYHNTIVYDQLTTGTSTQAGIWLLGTNTDLQVKNNNIVITGGNLGTKYGINYTTAASLSSIGDAQRNNIHVNSTQTGNQWYAANPTATTFADLAAFQAANPTLEVGSPSVDPLFIAPLSGNFTPGNALLFGSGANLLTSVPNDINGAVRAASPTPGAFEMSVTVGADGSVMNLITPSGIFCPGNQDISVSIANYGTTILTGFQIHWEVNGIAQTPYTYTGSLSTLTGAGQSMDTVMIGSANIAAPSSTIKAWTVIPNDLDNTNDTLGIAITPTIFAVNSATDTVCFGNAATINLDPGSGYATGMIQWESSTNGTSFTAIPNSDQSSWTANNLTANTWFRATINDGSTTCVTNNQSIVVSNPVITGTTPGTRCGTGTVQLGATADAGSSINWYDAATGGMALGTGNSFTTPVISTTTTYYAEPATGGGTMNVASPGIGTSNYWNTAVGWGLRFTANDLVTIDSVTIKAQGSSAGNASIQILVTDLTDAILYSGTVHTFAITTTSTEYSIPVNITVPPGNYKMVKSLTSTTSGISTMVRESSGVSFPYASPGNEILITAGANGANAAQTTSAYYWFYNWKISKGCVGTRVPVVATVAPGSLSVDLGNDTTICDGANFTLDAGANPGANYQWNTAETTQSIAVNNTGTYHVTVTQGLCTASDTIVVSVTPSPIVDLGNDTTDCINGGPITLTAGTSTSNTYEWSTGATSQSITATNSDIYHVTVTNAAGCATSDTIDVVMGLPPTVGGITVTGTSPNFNFSANNPANVTNYSWDFGEGTTSTEQNPVKQYTPGSSDQAYTVTLIVSNDCGSDTVETSVIVRATSINDLRLSADLLKLYPNPASQSVTIENVSSYKMKRIVITNVLGQQIMSHTVASGNTRTLDVSYLTSGSYHVSIEFEEGKVVRKLEILK